MCAQPITVLAQLVALALAARLRWDRFQLAGALGDAGRARDTRLEATDEPLQGVRADLYVVEISVGQEEGEVGVGPGLSLGHRH